MFALLFFSFMTATLTRWLDFVFYSHPIGRGYIAFVLKVGRRLSAYTGRRKYQRTMWLAKPLGYCIYCFGTWIVIFASLNFQIGIYEVLALIAINHFWLKATERIYSA
jgi:hypothetical protein